MIRFLRYISLRFWLVCLGALPLWFWVLPRFGEWVQVVPAPVVCAGIVVLVGLSLGLILDSFGIRRIRTLIREGELWERAGLPGKAETKYLRAMGIFDSAWISHRAVGRIGPDLRDAAARFYLSAGTDHPGLERAARLYLLAHPEDDTLAMLWLGRVDQENGPCGREQPVLTALADAHYANPEIRRHLVPEFLKAGRTDFSARRLYRYFQAEAAKGDCLFEDKEILGNIMALVGGTGEGGELNGTGPARENGLGRTLGDIKNGAGHIPVNRAADRQIMGTAAAPEPLLKSAGVAVTFLGGFKGVLAGAARLLGNKRVQQMIKLGAVSVLGVWLLIFAWTTLSHMVESTPEPAQRIEIRIKKPYTIQVAAYLKPAHADRYVAVLKKEGITATVKKTDAGGKTWYLVRVSEFTDKKRAADYGNRLKSQKIIDDFFVSNK